MTGKSPNPGETTPDFSEFFKEDFGVLLLRGKNNFGDRIYSYVKVSFPNIERMQQSIRDRTPFNPSDFGEIIAAGTGDPPPEVQAEISSQYPMIDQKPATPGPAAAPPPKKAWDEY